jgi:hypothetical protein
MPDHYKDSQSVCFRLVWVMAYPYILLVRRVMSLLTSSPRSWWTVVVSCSTSNEPGDGGSTGTNFYGALQIAAETAAQGEQGSIVTLACDPGDRYLGTYYDDAWVAAQGHDLEPYSARFEAMHRDRAVGERQLSSREISSDAGAGSEREVVALGGIQRGKVITRDYDIPVAVAPRTAMRLAVTIYDAVSGIPFLWRALLPSLPGRWCGHVLGESRALPIAHADFQCIGLDKYGRGLFVKRA